MKMLIVEDDKRLGKMIQLMMNAEGHHTTWLMNGADALDYTAVDEYDVILLDWMLPDMEGTEIIRELRNRRDDTLIVMMTAKGTVDNKVEGFTTGADDYIVKPFDFEELNVRIAALYRRKSGRTNDVLHIDPIQLDFHKHSLKINEHPIDLTNKEFQLMALLMENYEGIVGRDVILNKLWSIDDDVSENAIDALVKRLRQKVGDISPLMIKTVRNMGYVLKSL